MDCNMAEITKMKSKNRFIGRIIGLFILVSILLLALVSASIDKKVISQLNSKYDKIQIADCGFLGSSCWLGDGTQLATAELISNTEYCYENCEAVIKLNLLGKQNNPLQKVEFYKLDKQTKKSIKEFNIYYSTDNSHYQVYNNENLNAGTYYFKITGKKDRHDSIEWIPNLLGLDINEWASWNDALNQNIIAFYNMTSIQESVHGGNYNLVVNGCCGDPGFTAGQGIFRSAGDFGGSSRYTVPAIGASATPEEAFRFTTVNNTISLWVSTNAITAEALITKSFSNGGNGWDIYMTASGTFQVRGFSAGALTSSASSAVATGVWKHIALTTNDSSSCIWINGTLDTCTARTAVVQPANQTINFGSAYNFGDRYTGYMDEVGFWNRTLSATEISDLYSFRLSDNSTYIPNPPPDITLNSPNNGVNYTSLFGGSNTVLFSCTGLSLAGLSNISLWLNTSGTFIRNTTNIITGTTYNTTTFNKTIQDGSYLWNCEACNINNLCSFSSNRTFKIDTSLKFLENSQTYNSQILPNTLENFAIDITIDPTLSLSFANLSYNNTSYSASSINSLGSGNYIISTNLISPVVTTQTNKTFYWTFGLNNGTGINYYNSSSNNQSVTSLSLSITCGGGTFQFLNITNYDEETLNQMSGTVEYILSLLSSNLQIAQLNGNSTGTTLQFCSSQNLTGLYTNYNLQLRYYAPGDLYKTYNVQNSLVTNLPISIPLYYLNNTIGTIFHVTYTDFNYLNYPGAIMQIQRQYLSSNTYNIVEIPQLDNNGKATASFNANNIRYKIIVINQGVILDTFNDIFPSCQNIVLGQCDLNLRGTQQTPSNNVGDFTYTLVKTNTSVVLTYIIPSGTPRTIEFLTNQNSRFLDNITTCDQSIFASGGTFTCGYNQTIGDSIISTHIVNSDGSELYGNIQISEDLSSFFVLNNYFIGFIIILSLVLMFISSGVMLVIISAVGLLFLGVIFLLRGGDWITIGGSMAWLIIAIVLLIYKISQKEERT